MASVAANSVVDVEDLPNGPSEMLREELVEQGVPRDTSEDNHQAVRSSLQMALETGCLQYGRIWVTLVASLVLGMFGVLLWSDQIYSAHRHDYCDQPLGFMLRFLYMLVAVNAFRNEIVRIVLCFTPSADEPGAEPLRVTLFRRISVLAMFFWPCVAAWMLGQSSKCSPELLSAVRVVTIYYASVAGVVFLLPACFITALLCLIRRGLIRHPETRLAAPDGLIDQLPVIPYDAELFEDGVPGGYSTACPICLDAFEAERPISRTPCGQSGHAFHTDCLRGWLQCARTCPLCRVDLAEAAEADLEG